MNHLGPTLRRNRRKERPGWRVVAAIVLSLLVNALVVLKLDASVLGLGQIAPVRPVEMTPLTASSWEANRLIVDGSRPAPPATLAPRPPEPSPPKPPPDTVKAPGQVVDVAPSKNDAVPKDSRFVSDRNNTVEKETRSRFAKGGYAQTLPTPSKEAAAAKQGGALPGEEGSSEVSRAGRVGARAVEGQKLALNRPAVPPELLPPGPGGEVASPAVAPAQAAAAGAEAKPGEGEDGARRSGRSDPRLAVPAETFARLLGGPAPDHLAGVDEGDATFLNTREWKYATYFNRIKQAVAGSWDPQRALDQRDPDRSMFGFKDRFTLLAVTLDDAGSVKDLVVAKTSGVDFLDRSALDAFRKAQPFANPPRGIVDANGEIRFSFGFYLDVGHSGLRIYRGAVP